MQCRNGDLVKIAVGHTGIHRRSPVRAALQGRSILVEADSRTVADRRRLSFAGSVSVAIAIDDKGQLAADPELDLIGIPERDRAGELIADAVYDAVEETMEIVTAQAPQRSRHRGGSRASRGAGGGDPALG